MDTHQEHPSWSRRLARLVLVLSAAGALLVVGIGLAAAQSPAKYTRLTTGSDSARISVNPRLSANGQAVVFKSDSDFLGQGVVDNAYNIWLKNVATGVFTRVTPATAIQRNVYLPEISANGSRVVFWGDGDYLSQGILDNQFEVWLYRSDTLTLTRVTTSTQPGSRSSANPAISGNGNRIAFESSSDFRGEGRPGGILEIWLYDTAAMTMARVTSATALSGSSYDPALNFNGTRGVFHSQSDFLDQSPLPVNQPEVWLFDTTTLTLTRITTGTPSGRGNFTPRLSGAGDRIVFQSDADILGQGIVDNQFEIWLYDTTTLQYTRITTSSDGPNRISSVPFISADGQRVVFQSDSDFLGEGRPAGTAEMWLYDTATQTLTRVTGANPADRSSQAPSLNFDGSLVAFYSESDFLNQGILDSQFEVWLAEIRPDLQLSKSVSHSAPEIGERFTYTLVITNRGIEPATQAVVSDTLPAGLTFAGPVSLSPPGAGTVGSAPPALVTGLTVPALGQVTIAFPVTMATGISPTVPLTNTAWVTSAEIGAPVTGSVALTPPPPAPGTEKPKVYLPIVTRVD